MIAEVCVAICLSRLPLSGGRHSWVGRKKVAIFVCIVDCVSDSKVWVAVSGSDPEIVVLVVDLNWCDGIARFKMAGFEHRDGWSGRRPNCSVCGR